MAPRAGDGRPLRLRLSSTTRTRLRIDAAKKFIDFVCNDATAGVEAVKTSSFFPVHSDWGDVYADAEDADLRAPFALMSNYLGRYYNLTGRLDRAARPVVAHAR